MDDFTAELAKLHQLSGAEFSRQVEHIALRKEFHSLENDENIYSVGGENSDDYQNLLTAARKAVEFGYKVYMLPNPTETRTSSIVDSLLESIGQCNRILLNLTIDYNTRSLAFAININEKALDVLIFKGRKKISVNRSMATKPDFLLTFKRLYER